MAIWQYALLALGLAWAVQALGVWAQMRHYTDVFKGLTNRFNDGFVGAGQVRGSFRQGAIALVVVCPDHVVRRVLLMSGRSVFAKFRRLEAGEGAALAELGARLGQDLTSTEARAVQGAIEQIEGASARRLENDNNGLVPA